MAKTETTSNSCKNHSYGLDLCMKIFCPGLWSPMYIYVLEFHGQAHSPDKSEKIGVIKSTSKAFELLSVILVLSPKRSQKQNIYSFNAWLFCCWKRKNATFEAFLAEKQGWSIKGQMLWKLVLYPPNFFRFIQPVHEIPKWINGNISKVHHRKFSFFFSGFWLYKCFFQQFETASFFAIKISIYIEFLSISRWNIEIFGIPRA